MLNVQNLNCLLKVLNILFPIYALSTPFQHHIDKSQISESKTSPSSLTRRDDYLAILYWSPDGVLKFIANTYISPAVAWFFQYSAEQITSSIQLECYRRLTTGRWEVDREMHSGEFKQAPR